jgi:hypothetical protein
MRILHTSGRVAVPMRGVANGSCMKQLKKSQEMKDDKA